MQPGDGFVPSEPACALPSLSCCSAGCVAPGAGTTFPTGWPRAVAHGPPAVGSRPLMPTALRCGTGSHPVVSNPPGHDGNCPRKHRPDDVCSAQVRETGGFHGFTELPELPEEPVRVTLTVFDEAGEKLVHHTVESTPQPVHPNGFDGDSAGPQLRLDVAADGSVTPRG